MFGSFLGPSFSQAAIEKRLMALDGRFTVMSEDEMIETTAQALARQQAIGWFQGRMELHRQSPGTITRRLVLQLNFNPGRTVSYLDPRL
jgi:carbamoyltransferase